MSSHDDLEVCPSCKEWTSPGNDCCGYFECDEDCEVCNEVLGANGENAKEAV